MLFKNMEARHRKFQSQVWEYYRAHGRHDLPWRQFETDGHLDPYKVLVSEIMLQQTQVPRVIPKFESFIQEFPTVASLAAAPLSEVLKSWNGLGYNRRAKFLWQAANEIMQSYSGRVPDNQAALVGLPGIGQNTAGAVLAYAYNKPAVFVETNIRTVFFYHFFSGKGQVSDGDVAGLVAKTLPDNPREWYWALMDYGTYLKQTIGNLNKLSKHYSKQSSFSGSKRQIRGQVLRYLLGGPLDKKGLREMIPDERLGSVLQDLSREGLIQKVGRYYKLSEGHN